MQRYRCKKNWNYIRSSDDVSPAVIEGADSGAGDRYRLLIYWDSASRLANGSGNG